MVLELKQKLPSLVGLKVSRAVLVSGILTFLYIVEFCIGIRTVCIIFNDWYVPASNHNPDKTTTWLHWLGCLLFCLITTFAINTVSALWEKRQMVEEEQPRNMTKFVFHILAGGVLWRYVTLWCSEKKELQKKGALMLTILKFLFTQIFTIPIVIIHVSFLETLEEISFVVASAMCVALSLILTCVIFSWCSAEVEDLSTWDLESLNLVPLLFSQDEPVQTPKNEPAEANAETEQHSNPQPLNSNGLEEALIRSLVLLQTFSFIFGRLMALGILLKLAGVYAISILILQFLASVIYLKFQATLLVSDSLPKWKQLTRLAFLSYTLAFDWHLHRGHRTGYDYSANVKHSVFYYCLTILESIFYIVAWVIATSSPTQPNFDVQSEVKLKFISDVAIMGCLSVVFSLILHISLILWQSRRLKAFIHTMRRNLANRKLGMDTKSNNACSRKRDALSISNPKLFTTDATPVKASSKGAFHETLNSKNLERHSSYKDLKEPIDDEIEIYVRRNESAEKERIDKNETEYVPDARKDPCRISNSQWIDVAVETEEDIKVKCARRKIKSKEQRVEVNRMKKPCYHNEEEVIADAYNESFSKIISSGKTDDVIQSRAKQMPKNSAAKSNGNNDSVTLSSDAAYEAACNQESVGAKQSAISKISKSVFQQLNKLADISRRFSGEVQLRIQKKKEQNKEVGDVSKNIENLPQIDIANSVTVSYINTKEFNNVDAGDTYSYETEQHRDANSEIQTQNVTVGTNVRTVTLDDNEFQAEFNFEFDDHNDASIASADNKDLQPNVGLKFVKHNDDNEKSQLTTLTYGETISDDKFDKNVCKEFVKHNYAMEENEYSYVFSDMPISANIHETKTDSKYEELNVDRGKRENIYNRTETDGSNYAIDSDSEFEESGPSQRKAECSHEYVAASIADTRSQNDSDEDAAVINESHSVDITSATDRNEEKVSIDIGETLHDINALDDNEKKDHVKSTCPCYACRAYRIQMRRSVSEPSQCYDESPLENIPKYTSSPHIECDQSNCSKEQFSADESVTYNLKPKLTPRRITKESMKKLSVLKQDENMEYYV